LDHQGYDAFEDRAKMRAVEQTLEPDHRLGIGYRVSVDPAESAISDVPPDLSLELVEGPILDVAKDEHPKDDLSRCAVSATSCAPPTPAA
jgi:hypothetical protein